MFELAILHVQSLLSGRNLHCACVCLVRILETPGTAAHQAPLSMGFSMQEYWSGPPFPIPGDLPNPGIEPVSPALQVSSLLLSQQGSQNLHWGLLLCWPRSLFRFFWEEPEQLSWPIQ